MSTKSGREIRQAFDRYEAAERSASRWTIGIVCLTVAVLACCLGYSMRGCDRAASVVVEER